MNRVSIIRKFWEIGIDIYIALHPMQYSNAKQLTVSSVGDCDCNKLLEPWLVELTAETFFIFPLSQRMPEKYA